MGASLKLHDDSVDAFLRGKGTKQQFQCLVPRPVTDMPFAGSIGGSECPNVMRFVSFCHGFWDTEGEKVFP